MRTKWSDLDRLQRIAVEWGTCSRAEASLTSLQGGASIGILWLLEEDMWRSPLSEYMSLHPSLAHHRNINSFENKVWEMYVFIKKCVHSFIEVHKLCLIMSPLVYVWEYTTKLPICGRIETIRTTALLNWLGYFKEIWRAEETCCH